jgi:hypothetical protein
MIGELRQEDLRWSARRIAHDLTRAGTPSRITVHRVLARHVGAFVLHSHSAELAPDGRHSAPLSVGLNTQPRYPFASANFAPRI